MMPKQNCRTGKRHVSFLALRPLYALHLPTGPVQLLFGLAEERADNYRAERPASDELPAVRAARFLGAAPAFLVGRTQAFTMVPSFLVFAYPRHDRNRRL
jgi:hypothetical protein